MSDEKRETLIQAIEDVWLCDACLNKRTIAQLQRSLYTSPFAKDLREDLRAGFEARLKELTKAVA